jgi:hypothetical protein
MLQVPSLPAGHAVLPWEIRETSQGRGRGQLPPHRQLGHAGGGARPGEGATPLASHTHQVMAMCGVQIPLPLRFASRDDCTNRVNHPHRVIGFEYRALLHPPILNDLLVGSNPALMPPKPTTWVTEQQSIATLPPTPSELLRMGFEARSPHHPPMLNELLVA